MKKIVIISLILIITTIGGTILGISLLNYRTIGFKLTEKDYSVRIYEKGSDKLIAELDKSEDLRLAKGEYYYVTIGSNTSVQEFDFNVDDDTTPITVRPSYSRDYLSSLIPDQLISVQNLLKSSYGDIVKDYETERFRLYGAADWGAGYLIQKVDPGQSPDIYRYVVQKKNGQWQFVATPQLIISKSAYPQIPDEVLQSINAAVN